MKLLTQTGSIEAWLVPSPPPGLRYIWGGCLQLLPGGSVAQ